MNFENYTKNSQNAIMAAQKIAQDARHQAIDPLHVLLALLQQDQGVVSAIIKQVAGSTAALTGELKKTWTHGQRSPARFRMLAFRLLPQMFFQAQNASQKVCGMNTCPRNTFCWACLSPSKAAG